MTNEKLQNLRVLSVDDDPFMLEIFTETLARIGIEDVVTKDTAAEALDYIKENVASIDILLCDLYMPKMDGIEFMSELLSFGFAGKVILISGASENVILAAEKLAEARGTQILGTLKKPVLTENLRALLLKAV